MKNKILLYVTYVFSIGIMIFAGCAKNEICQLPSSENAPTATLDVWDGLSSDEMLFVQQRILANHGSSRLMTITLDTEWRRITVCDRWVKSGVLYCEENTSFPSSREYGDNYSSSSIRTIEHFEQIVSLIERCSNDVDLKRDAANTNQQMVWQVCGTDNRVKRMNRIPSLGDAAWIVDESYEILAKDNQLHEMPFSAELAWSTVSHDPPSNLYLASLYLRIFDLVEKNISKKNP